jgi:hypothetical protein
MEIIPAWVCDACSTLWGKIMIKIEYKILTPEEGFLRTQETFCQHALQRPDGQLSPEANYKYGAKMATVLSHDVFILFKIFMVDAAS